MKYFLWIFLCLSANAVWSQASGETKPVRRTKLTNLKPDSIKSDVDCTISLKVYIDEKGKVIKVENNERETTTNDEILIQKVIDQVKQEIIYDERPGAPVIWQMLTIRISADK